MTLEEAIEWMGPRYCMSKPYRTNPCPWHNVAYRYPGYDLRDSLKRVRERQAAEQAPAFNLSDEIAKRKAAMAEAYAAKRLRLVHGRVVTTTKEESAA